MRSSSHKRFKRSSTVSILDRRPQRMRHQQSLPAIEEDQQLSEDNTGSSDQAKKALESRPTFLHLSTPSSEDHSTKKAAIVLKRKKAKFSEDLSALSPTDASPKMSKSLASVLHPRKRANRRQSTDLPPTSGAPAIERRKHRKALHSPKSPLAQQTRRPPPLKNLKGDSNFTSSEFQADVEDFDVSSPQPKTSSFDMQPGPKRKESGVSLMAVNQAALAAEQESPPKTCIAMAVQAEVHCDHSLPEETRSTPAQRPPTTSESSPLLPPPPASYSTSHSSAHSPLTSLALHSKSPSLPHSSSSSTNSPSLPHPPQPISFADSPSLSHPPLTATPTPESAAFSRDSDSLHDCLIPRGDIAVSPPSKEESVPSDSDMDTDTLLPQSPSGSSRSGTSQGWQKRLSFDRRQKSKGIPGHLNSLDDNVEL